MQHRMSPRRRSTIAALAVILTLLALPAGVLIGRGQTVVGIPLVCLAVLGVAIGAAYVITSRRATR